jgi:RND family efflux transporter MFP subunit
MFSRHYHATRSFFLAVAGLICLFPPGGCSRKAPVTNKPPVPKVTVTEVVLKETLDSDEYTGRTEASEIVEVRARIFGYLKSIEFSDGDLVEEGQTLFTVEPDEYAAIHQQSLSRIDLNAANLNLAKTKCARMARLIASKAVSQEEYDEALAAVAAAEATISVAKADADRTALDLKYTVIKAPISGRIDRALLSRGNLLVGGLSSGSLLTKIVQEQPMHVYFDVDERSLLSYMRQRRGQRDSAPGSLRDQEVPCYLQLADETDFSHQGKLDFAAAEVQSTTGTARIRGVFANPNRALVSGLFVRVRIPVSEPYQACMIPEPAILTDQNVKFVYVLGEDAIAIRRNIELGAQRGELRIVKSGLKAGERIIIKGMQRVKPNQKVEPELTRVPVIAPALISENP